MYQLLSLRPHHVFLNVHYHGSNRPCGVKVCVYLWMMEAVRPGNDIYSDTWAKAILSRDTSCVR
jgi:hypothetical protein